MSSSFELEIASLARGGSGVGRRARDGMVCFVPGTCPGDLVEVEIQEVKKNHLNCRLVRLIRPSEDRVEPPCPHFGPCGGCTWQHVSYGRQVSEKASIVRQALKRIPFLNSSDLEDLVCEPSPKEYHYRNRITLHTQGGAIGYRKRQSHELEPIQECLIAEDSINRQISDWYANVQKTNGPTEQRSVPFRSNSSLSPGSRQFSQVNEPVNQALKSHLSDVVEGFEKEVEACLELYSGAGNLTEILLEKLPNRLLISVEENVESVQEQRRNATQDNFHVVQARVENHLRFWRPNKDQNWLYLVDPPRTGLAPEVLSWMAKFPPRFLIYISCDPMTLARDLEFLGKQRQLRFHLKDLRAFDMFPQTDHVESLVALQISIC